MLSSSFLLKGIQNKQCLGNVAFSDSTGRDYSQVFYKSALIARSVTFLVFLGSCMEWN